jgi:hypothetical protein
VTDRHRAWLREQERRADMRIMDAYWTFTRTRGGKPPSMVVPDAYRRRAQVRRLLKGPL